MANSLVSPGVQVSVIDESNYAPTAVGTIPFIVMATAQDKTNNSGSIAAGTTKANTGNIYNIGDQRSLVNLFGMPMFPTDASGNRIYGSELAEYGLYAAYHVLDSISSVYVVRADIDLDQLEASENRPFSKANGGTLWLDTSITSWGTFAWDAYEQTFTRIQPDFLYTSENVANTGAPASSYGNIGSYAIVGYENNENPLYYKNYLNAWVRVGSDDWKKSVPTIVATKATGSTNLVTPGQAIIINGITITASGTTAATLATDINSYNSNAGIPGVTAYASNGVLSLYAFINSIGTLGSKSGGNSAPIDGKIAISNSGGGTILTVLGIDGSVVYACPAVQFSKHSSVPQWKSINSTPRPSGSIWVKTTNFNYGANMSTYIRNAVTSSWNLVPNLVYGGDADANFNLDPTQGGLGIAQNSLYTTYNVSNDGSVGYKTYIRYTTGPTVITSDGANVLTPGNTFTVSVSQIGTSAISTPVTITIAASPNNTVARVASDILAANIPNLTASVNTSGQLVLTHTAGGTIYLRSVTGTPLDALGITTDLINVRLGFNSGVVGSNWIIPYNPAIIEQPYEPLAVPNDGRLWFYSGVYDVDIMINENNEWKGYRNVTSDARGYNLSNTDVNGPIVSASAPTLNSIGSALNYGDLWIDTSAIDGYPRIWRWQRVSGSDQWYEVDTTDATTENGIVFGDARWDIDGTSDVFLDDIVPISDMLLEDYIDLDAPNANLYPNGCLLFNTRRSSNNVKMYVENYFTVEKFSQQSLPDVKATWQTHSGKRYNNVPFFGRQAVRNVVVSAMAEAVNNNAALREEGYNFNLLCAPGYTEMLTVLKELNDDRKNTGFVIGEVPMGLSTDQTTVTNYLIDAVGSGLDGEDGLTSTDAYTAVFYPGAATMTALDGVGSIVVPMSALILRTFVLSDQNSELWFAPAGNARGVVDAIAIGYVDRANFNAFVRTGTPQGLRDLLYTNRVNPVTYFPQVGIINYGNHTRQASATALDRINVARLVCYLRATLEKIVRPLVFEPNDKITRDKAKAICDSLLNDVLARRGVYDYLTVCDTTNNSTDAIDRNELHIDIAIEPVKSVEFIYIPVRIKATGQIARGDLAPALALG